MDEQLLVNRVLDSLRVIDLPIGDRDAALARLAEEAAAIDGSATADVLLTAVRERESSLSSRVSDLVAMPHAIVAGLTRTRVVVGASPDGVRWDSREPRVQLVVLLVGPQDTHLPVMARLARNLQDHQLVAETVARRSIDAVRDLAAGAIPARLRGRRLAVTAATVAHAAALAGILADTPIVVAAPGPGIASLLGPLAEPPLARRTVVIGPGPVDPVPEGLTVVPSDRLTHDRTAAITLLPLVASGLIGARQSVILVTGAEERGGLDAVRLVNVSRELQVPEGFGESHLPSGVRLEVVIRVLHLAAELGLQGREGKPVGTIFVIGDDPALSAVTQQMILNPFSGYPESERNILDPSLTETVKELAKMDGAFVVSGDGTIRSAGTHLAGKPDPGEMEAGQGARHAAALGITAGIDVLAVCLSESTGSISVYQRGRRVIRK